MKTEKEEFLRNGFIHLISMLDAQKKGHWGLMNAQQMVEHMTDSVRIANGKEYQGIELSVERVVKVREFFLSEKPFRENTGNHLLPAVPPPVRNLDMKEAINELDIELEEFFDSFEKDSERKTINPFAGEFGKNEWVHLLHKHAEHHARQFGLLK